MPEELASTESHERVSVTIDGRDEGLFDKMTGREQTAEVAKHRPGGSATSRFAMGGPINYGDRTLSRKYMKTRDGDLERRLLGRAGKARIVVSSQDLDEDLNPYGRPTTTMGLIMTVSRSDYDSDSNTPGELSILLSVESVS